MESEKRLSDLALEIRHAVPNRGIDDGFAAEVCEGWQTVSFEQILIQAVVLIEQLERDSSAWSTCRWPHLRGIRNRHRQFRERPRTPRFREEDMGPEEAIEIDLALSEPVSS